MILCTCLFPTILLADSAVDVAAMPQKELMQVLSARKVPISASQAKLFLSVLPQSIARNELEQTFKKSNSVSLLAILPHIVNKEGSQPVLASLREHDDAFLRFVANCGLAGSGDSDAAKKVHALLHDAGIGELEKRLIKTWAMGAGINPKKDDAEAILSHLMSLISKKQKFTPGEGCPQFSAITSSGVTLDSKTFKGKVVVLHFWASSCAPCLNQMPKHIGTLSNLPQDNVCIVFVSLDENKERFEASITKFGMPFHNVFDGNGWGGPLARTFGVNQLPFDVVIDSNGKFFSNSIEKLPDSTR